LIAPTHFLKPWKYLFGSVVAVIFQSAFHLKMHQNNIFYFIFKKLFLISVHQNDLKTLKNINLKKNLIFLKVFLKCENKQVLE
jgi:hypothetical protein